MRKLNREEAKYHNKPTHSGRQRAKIGSSEWYSSFLRREIKPLVCMGTLLTFSECFQRYIILSNMVATGHMWLLKLIKLKIQALNHTNHISRVLCSHGVRGYWVAWHVCCILSHAWLFATSWTDCSLPDSSVHGNSPGKDTGVGCHALLQGIFLTQRSNPCLLHCQVNSLPLRQQGSPDT